MLTKTQQNMGFFEAKDKKIRLDWNLFAIYIRDKYKIIYTDSFGFKYYARGKYASISENRIKSIMAKIILANYYKLYFLEAEHNYFNALKSISYYGGKFNKCKGMLCLKNGMYDMEKDILLPHNPEYFCTVQFPIEYDKMAKCPEFIKFLKSITINDKNIMKFIQELLGYCMIDNTHAQKFFMLYGSGANGKSVLCNIIMALVGEENYESIPIRDMSKSFSRAALMNKALNIATENESVAGKTTDTQYIKSISSGDSIKAEFKGKDVFKFKPYCKLIFCINTLPQFNDKSAGFFRRIEIIPFNNHYSIKDGTADIHIEEKLMGELSGIFNLAIRGLKRLIANNYRFTESHEMKVLKSQYETLINPYKAFWNECVLTQKDDDKEIWETKDAIYRAFIAWCNENKHTNYSRITPRRFWMEFSVEYKTNTNESIKYKKTGGRRYIVGICLKKCRPKDCTHYMKLDFLYSEYDEDLTSEAMKEIVAKDDKINKKDKEGKKHGKKS